MTERTMPLGGAQRVSAICAGGCLALAGAIPLAIIAMWGLGSWHDLAIVRLVPSDIIHTMAPIPHLWQRVVGAGITLFPALLFVYGLLRAHRCLAAFARGEYFAADAVDGLRDYAAWTFWAAIAGIVSVPLLSISVTIANVPGHRELSADFSGAQIVSLLGAGIVWVIASAMARASSIARENEQFV